MYVYYKQPNVATVAAPSGETFAFLPGANQIDGKLWSKLLENKHFKADVDAKHYQVEQDIKDEDEGDEEGQDAQPGASAQPRATPFMKAPEDAASRVISETYDIKTLKEMRRNETRPQMIAKIEGQIQRLQEERRSNRGRVNTDEDS